MLKKISLWTAAALVIISLLTETAYRLLSMEASKAADGKDCVVLVLGWPTEADGSLHPMQRFGWRPGLQSIGSSNADRSSSPAAQRRTAMLKGRQWQLMRAALVCRRAPLPGAECAHNVGEPWLFSCLARNSGARLPRV